jgi:membrane-bound lytic murein transglycosylase B
MGGLLTNKSIARGRQVLSQNDDFFRKLEVLYGVEKEPIVAIFRVETNLGSYIGAYPVFNSLLTIATIPNRRSEWAEDELVHLAVICRDLEKDPLSVKGSWAGAFGLCQFIPSSFRAYAVDGDDDGIINVFTFYDAMASIANYLRSNSWQNDDEAKQKEAIYTYNNSHSYVEAVLAYAKATKAGSRVSRKTALARRHRLGHASRVPLSVAGRRH